MTYSALPKPREPPVNSVEYYQMQMQQHGGQGFANIQQAAAPAHIQSAGSGSGALSDLYRGGSIFDAPAPQRQDVARQQQQQQQAAAGGNNLSSLRHQYMSRTKDTIQDELPSQPFQNISRTIVGEDIGIQKAPASKAYQPPGVIAPPPPPQSMQQAPQQEQEQPLEQDMAASEDVSHPADEATAGVNIESEN